MRRFASFVLVLLAASACNAVEDEAGSSASAVVDSETACDAAADNHSPSTATRIATVSDDAYTYKVDGRRVVSDAAPNWYVFEAKDTSFTPARLLKPAARVASTSPFVILSPVRVCVFAAADVSCSDGEPAEAEGMNGCCGTVDEDFSAARMNLESAFTNDTQDVYVRVESVRPGCHEFLLQHAGAGLVGL